MLEDKQIDMTHILLYYIIILLLLLYYYYIIIIIILFFLCDTYIIVCLLTLHVFNGRPVCWYRDSLE